jgi:type II secretory pathway pseudopilin PulG
MRKVRVRMSAFTLVEVVVALAFVVICVSTILFAITHGLQGIRQNGIALHAQTALTRQVEFLRRQAFDNLPLFNETTFAEGLENMPAGTVGRRFVGTITGDNNLRQVTVSVTSEGRTWRMGSLIAR